MHQGEAVLHSEGSIHQTVFKS